MGGVEFMSTKKPSLLSNHRVGHRAGNLASRTTTYFQMVESSKSSLWAPLLKCAIPACIRCQLSPQNVLVRCAYGGLEESDS